jgi:hypothetical protein
MLFWLSIIILLVGIGIYIWYDNFYHHYRDWIESLYFILNAVGSIATIVSITIMLVNHIGVDAGISKKEQTYKSLVYQYEKAVLDWDDDVVGKKELYNQIQEWNSDLAYYQSAQDSFWMGIYYPNVFDQFDYIELNRK